MTNVVYPDSIEPELYPNTSTFVNHLGIRDRSALLDKEADFTAIRSIELIQQTDLIKQTFDFYHLKAIHYYLFQDLYAWAGMPRSYNMKKGGDIFTPANKLPGYETEVFSQSIDVFNLNKRPSTSETTISLARCLGIINIFHPFPEGNGRAQRLFISSLARMHQYSLNWSRVHPWEIVETSKAVHKGNYAPLEHLMNRIILDDNQP